MNLARIFNHFFVVTHQDQYLSDQNNNKFQSMKIYLFMGEMPSSNKNWRVQISCFARISVIKLGADTKRRRSSFMMYVKKSLSANSSMF